MTTRVNIKNSVWAQFLRPVANFNIRLFTMAIVIVLVVGSCGKDDKDDDDKGGDDTEMTAANWQKVIKDALGFDLTVPTGWTFVSGEKAKSNPYYDLRFTTSGDFATAYPAFMQYVFDLTAAVVPADGNFDVDLATNQMGSKYTEIPNIMGEPLPIWYFNTPTYCVQVSLSGASGTKTAQIYMINMGTKKQ